MSLSLRWVGEEELDDVAATRLHCYGNTPLDLDRLKEGIRADTRAEPGDFLLAARGSTLVGTATSLSMTMYVRGAPLACQGVAWVGAIKTERRRSSLAAIREPGVASSVMWEVLRKAREREQVVSALMPFRASFYEHFGYGIVERRVDWTIPLTLLPAGPIEGWRLAEPGDVPSMAECRRVMVLNGQCNIDRAGKSWDHFRNKWEHGFAYVHVAAPGKIDAWTLPMHSHVNGKDLLRLEDWSADSLAGFQSLLHFLATLRDQYYSVLIPLPTDWPLNLLLTESQIPHRPVNHAVAHASLLTRMQIRILDHRRFLEAIRWPVDIAGGVTVAVREVEGELSKFRLDVEHGHAAVRASQETADFQCDDKTWAAIACGALPATQAVRLGLAEDASGAGSILDGLSRGPAPFCSEYF